MKDKAHDRAFFKIFFCTKKQLLNGLVRHVKKNSFSGCFETVTLSVAIQWIEHTVEHKIIENVKNFHKTQIQHPKKLGNLINFWQKCVQKA